MAGVLGLFTGLVLTVCTYLIPAYFSHKALESHVGLENWLTYWCVLGLISAIEYVGWFLLSRCEWTGVRIGHARDNHSAVARLTHFLYFTGYQ